MRITDMAFILNRNLRYLSKLYEYRIHSKNYFLKCIKKHIHGGVLAKI